MEKRNKKLIKNTAILSFGTFCTKGIMFIMTPLFTHWLSQEDYGTFDLILTYITLLIPIIVFNCSEATFRFLIESDEKEKQSIMSNTIVIHLIGFLIGILVIAIMGSVYLPIRKIAIYFGILLLLEVTYNTMTMILRGLKKLPIYAIANILFVVVMVISVTLFVKVKQMGLNGIILGYIIGYAVSVLFMILTSRTYQYFSIKHANKKLLKEMLKYCIPLIPTGISWWVMNASDRTIVSIVLGTSANAVLAVANKIPNLCQTFFNVFHLSWQENAIETRNDEDRDRYYNDIFNKMIKVLISISVVILSGNFILFKYLFTDDYFGAYYQVPILIGAIIISMLAKFLGAIYISNMESKKSGITTLIAAIINLVVHLGLINIIGLYAATISTIISYLVLFIIRYKDIRKSTNIRLNKGTINAIIMLIYFFIANYINNQYVNIVNLLVAGSYFIIVNKKSILELNNKLKNEICEQSQKRRRKNGEK